MGWEDFQDLGLEIKRAWLQGVAPKPLFKYCNYSFGCHLVLEHWWYYHKLLQEIGGIARCRRDGWENQQGAERRMWERFAHRGGARRVYAEKALTLLNKTVEEKWTLWHGAAPVMQDIVAAYSFVDDAKSEGEGSD